MHQLAHRVTPRGTIGQDKEGGAGSKERLEFTSKKQASGSNTRKIVAGEKGKCIMDTGTADCLVAEVNERWEREERNNLRMCT